MSSQPENSNSDQTPAKAKPEGIYALSGRSNSGITNTSYELRTIIAIEDRGYHGGYLALVGECGHVLDQIPGAAWSVDDWKNRIAFGKPSRKRCRQCPKPDNGWV